MSTESKQQAMAERLRKPVQFLKGVGPRLAPLLERLGLRTAKDILFHFPRGYEDLTHVTPIAQIQEGGQVCVCATVEELALLILPGGKSVLGVVLRDETAPIRAVWFNQPYLQEKLTRGTRVMLSGMPKRQGLCFELAHPRVVVLGASNQPVRGEMLSLYASTDGLKQPRLRHIVRLLLDEFAEGMEEVFPGEFLSEHQLLPISTALRWIHQPASPEQAEQARRRFVYQELFVLQLALALRRWQLQKSRQAPAMPATTKINARIHRLFPFELTADQQQAIDEIAADLGRSIPMNRLLQGEVGSGKTVVAEYAMLLAVAHGYQAVLMAPTEVLARQHLSTLSDDLSRSRVRMALLTGSLTPSQRTKLHDSVTAGEVDLVIGTQALLHEELQFPRLGLVVIDEQHKFGVRQRAALKSAGAEPHYLVMTATPIPRTVTMSLFGDLDVSTLRQPPPGRQNVHTYLGTGQQREKWWEFFCGKLREGRQGYVIVPRVEVSDTEDVSSVAAEYERLTNGPLEAFRVDLIHGRMSSAEKETAMDAFRRGWTQVLVATSVIEVGVNVPNATVMTIEDGQRFGLAQLHQLRGRVRRGKFPGYVCVFATPANPAAQERLDAFTHSTDGFELAEMDFALRGPGDLFGTRQHGMPPLRVADLQRDGAVLEEARRNALTLIAMENSDFFHSPFDALRRQVLRRYGEVLDLGDVG